MASLRPLDQKRKILKMPVRIIFLTVLDFFFFSLATTFETAAYHDKKQLNDIFGLKLERVVMKN